MSELLVGGVLFFGASLFLLILLVVFIALRRKGETLAPPAGVARGGGRRRKKKAPEDPPKGPHPAIEAAIKRRALLRFDYEGGSRVVESWCHGVSTADHDVLRGYQLEGFSQSDEMGWKLFRVSRIGRIEELADSFESDRSEYNPDDRAMKRIYCRVER